MSVNGRILGSATGWGRSYYEEWEIPWGDVAGVLSTVATISGYIATTCLLLTAATGGIGAGCAAIAGAISLAIGLSAVAIEVAIDDPGVKCDAISVAFDFLIPGETGVEGDLAVQVTKSVAGHGVSIACTSRG